jgi:PAS domain S-box
MQKDSIAVLKRALQREKAARKEAEKILETKSRELYYLSKELQTSNSKLKKLLNAKSSELQVFFDNIIDAYVVIDLNGKIVKYNKPAIDLFGFDKDKDISDVFELVPKEDLEHAQASFFELFTKGEFKNYEGRVYSKDNSIKWVQINASVIYDEEHNPIAAQGILRDITSDKEAEDLLIESENRLASLITNLDSAVLLEDENRHILLTNTKFCNLFKIPVAPSELKGQDCSNAAENSKHLFTNSNAFVKRINQIVKQKQQVIADEITMTDGTVLERDFIPILKNNIYKGHLWTYKKCQP